MERHRLILWSWLFLEFIMRAVGQSDGTVKYIQEADQIFNSVFHKYNERVPPKQTDTPVWVELRVTLVHVNNLDVMEQALESIIDMEVSWKDSRLFWYPLLVTKITVNSSSLWIPDIAVLNAIQPVEVVISPDLVVKSSTEIYYNRRLKTKTFCQTNMSSSTHDCPLIIGARVLDTNTQDFNMSSVSFSGVSAYSNHKWQILSTNVEPQMRDAYLNFTDLHMNLQLQRTTCCQGEGKPGPVYSEQTGNSSGAAHNHCDNTVIAMLTVVLFAMVLEWKPVF